MNSEVRTLDLSHDNLNAAIESFLRSMRLISDQERVEFILGDKNPQVIIKKEAIN